MQKMKKILAFILAFALVFGCVPVESVNAAEARDTSDDGFYKDASDTTTTSDTILSNTDPSIQAYGATLSKTLSTEDANAINGGNITITEGQTREFEVNSMGDEVIVDNSQLLDAGVGECTFRKVSAIESGKQYFIANINYADGIDTIVAADYWGVGNGSSWPNAAGLGMKQIKEEADTITEREQNQDEVLTAGNLWTITSTGTTDEYYIHTSTGRYIQIEGNNKIHLTDTKSVVSVTEFGTGYQIANTSKGTSLNYFGDGAWGTNFASGWNFANDPSNAPGSIWNLYQPTRTLTITGKEIENTERTIVWIGNTYYTVTVENAIDGGKISILPGEPCILVANEKGTVVIENPNVITTSNEGEIYQKATEIESGKQYFIANINYADNKDTVVTTKYWGPDSGRSWSDAAGFRMKVITEGTDAITGQELKAENLWTITATETAEQYYVQTPEGKYLNIVERNNLNLSDTPVAASITTLGNGYQIANTSKSVSLNYFGDGGSGTTFASGWDFVQNHANGSAWNLYRPVTTLTVNAAQQEGETKLWVGATCYTVVVNPKKELYYFLSTFPVWEGADGDAKTKENDPWVIIKASQVATEEGIEISTFAPKENCEWKYVTEAVPTVYWKTTKLDADRHQTAHAQETASIYDQSLYGIDFSHIRYYDAQWQVKQVSDNTWINIEDDDQLVSYYLQKTATTTEVTTYVKDWAFTPGDNSYSQRDQKALSFAVVYPDGQMRPAEGAVYMQSTLLYWDNLDDIGFILFEEKTGYTVTKITYTMGQRTGHDRFANHHYTWGIRDTITWEKLEETQWYDETTIWTPETGTEPIVDGRTLEDRIYPGEYKELISGSYTNFKDGTWGKDDAVLLLIYLKAEGDLEIRYVDDSKEDADGNPTEFFSFDIIPKDPLADFGDLSIPLGDLDGDGDLDLHNDATLENASGAAETIEKDLLHIPTLDDSYKTGNYEYQYVELADDGKTLVIHYNVKPPVTVKYIDVTTGEEIYSYDTVPYDREETFKNSETFGTVTDTDGDGDADIVEGSYIKNGKGVNEVVETDLEKIDDIDQKYKDGYSYRYVEVSEDGRTLEIYYGLKELIVEYVDLSSGEEIYSYEIEAKDKTEDFKNSETFGELTDTDEDGDHDITEGSYITNTKGENETVTPDLDGFDEVADKYKDDEAYRYEYVEVSEDGKKLTVYYVPIFRFVIDFGIPVNVDMTKLNLEGVTITEITGTKIDGDTKYGELTANGTVATYTLGTVMKDVQTGTISYNYTNAAGTAEHGVIGIQFIPATTVYYEEGFAVLSEGWTGGTKGSAVQQATLVGAEKDFNNSEIAAFNYGYDSAYASETAGPSGGTQAVSSAENDTATFTFKGTGVEIYTNNTPATGHVLAYLRDGNGNFKAIYVVDTMMKSGESGGTEAQDVDAYNVPIINIRGLAYGDYQIDIKHVKTSSDESVEPVNLDGFRVIGTLPLDYEAYEKDGEANPEFEELRDATLVANLSDDTYGSENIYADEIANGIMSQVYAYSQDKNYKAIVLDQGVENLVREATLSASSQETNDFPASNAGDGDYGSRWSSKSIAGSNGDEVKGEELKAVFTEEKDIKLINVFFHDRNKDPMHSNTAKFSIKCLDASGNIVFEEVDHPVDALDGGYATKVSIELEEKVAVKELILYDFATKIGTTQWNSVGITELEAYPASPVSDYVDYVDNGPKNEIYLKTGQTLVFKVNAEDAQIGLKALNAETSYTVQKGSAVVLENQNFASSTDMYYELNPEGAEATYTITNHGEGILAVTLLKIFAAEQVTDLTAMDLQPALVNMGYQVKETEEKPAATPVTDVFSDVADGAWYVDAVQYVYDKEIMSGNDGLFNPSKEMTRAQIVLTLYRLSGSPEVTDYSACDVFSDVADGAWYTDAVCWAYNTGVTSGNSETTFGTNVSLTREQLATFFYRYANNAGFDTTAVGDLSGLENAENVKSYAVDAVKWAVGAGLISGSEVADADGNISYDLAPQATATRAQLAKVLMNFCEAYGL